MISNGSEKFVGQPFQMLRLYGLSLSFMFSGKYETWNCTFVSTPLYKWLKVKLASAFLVKMSVGHTT